MEATSFLLVGEEEPGNPSPGFQSHIGCGVWGRQREKWASPLSASPQGCLGAALSRGRNGEVGGEPCAVGARSWRHGWKDMLHRDGPEPPLPVPVAFPAPAFPGRAQLIYFCGQLFII